MRCRLTRSNYKQALIRGLAERGEEGARLWLWLCWRLFRVYSGCLRRPASRFQPPATSQLLSSVFFSFLMPLPLPLPLPLQMQLPLPLPLPLR
jgi:hypothetical protein